MPVIYKRRPYDRRRFNNSLLESDSDFVDNNLDAAVELLTLELAYHNTITEALEIALQIQEARARAADRNGGARPYQESVARIRKLIEARAKANIFLDRGC